MIIRLIAVDPRPRPGSEDDVVVYQVPENSRAHRLLEEVFAAQGIECVVMEAPVRKRKEK
jgi:hypothetical protein